MAWHRQQMIACSKCSSNAPRAPDPAEGGESLWHAGVVAAGQRNWNHVSYLMHVHSHSRAEVNVVVHAVCGGEWGCAVTSCSATPCCPLGAALQMRSTILKASSSSAWLPPRSTCSGTGRTHAHLHHQHHLPSHPPTYRGRGTPLAQTPPWPPCLSLIPAPSLRPWCTCS